VFSDEIAFL